MAPDTQDAPDAKDKPKLLIIGAGGHAKVLIDMVEVAGMFQVAGLLDAGSHEQQVLGYPLLGNDDALPDLYQQGYRFAFVALGNNRLRLKLAALLETLGFECPNLISPSATVSRHVSLGKGIAIMPGAVVNVGSVIGNQVIINTGATVDHDNLLEDAAFIGPGCHLAGNVKVGKGAFMGTGASVIPNTSIGAWATVGAGAAVIHTVAEQTTVVGVPARPLNKNTV